MSASASPGSLIEFGATPARNGPRRVQFHETIARCRGQKKQDRGSPMFRCLITIVFLWLSSASAYAQDAESAEDEQTSAAEAAEAAADEQDETDLDEENYLDAEEEDFVPTEDIPTDQAIPFPTDI
jgi:hypothetical protein